MKRAFAALTLALALIFATTAASFQNSPYQPLQTSTGRNFCSAFSIDQKHHYFATAGHCVDEDNPMLPTAHMFGMRVKVVYFDRDHDMAVVQAAFGAPAIKLSHKAPKAGDIVHVTGYPYGFPKMTTAEGRVLYDSMDLQLDADHSQAYMLYDMTVAGGNSGSPVMDAEGNVISILQIKFTNSNISGGSTFDMLPVLEPYAQ